MPDWDNPSETDIAEAKEHGLDLMDPAVQVWKSWAQLPLGPVFFSQHRHRPYAYTWTLAGRQAGKQAKRCNTCNLMQTMRCTAGGV